MSDLPRGATVRSDAGLYGYERALRRTGLVHIAGAGHNVRRENKAQTLEVLNAFLAGS